MKISGLIFSVFLLFISCTRSGDAAGKQTSHTLTPRSIAKPPSSYQDTLRINFPAAVFYHPDSIQLQKIKISTATMVFDGSMHEFFYQMRNARKVIKKNWLDLKIVEAKNYRYLLFIKENNSRECIDLDTKPDAYGLIVFDTKKTALPVDMTNIETQVSFYLNKK